MKIKRLSEEEFFERVSALWKQFHTRPEMQNISFEDFKKECYEEFQKQKQMSDENLNIYRKKCYNNIIKEIDKLTTKEEKEKMNNEDKRTIVMKDKI